MMKMYDISADNGNSWTTQWLTESEKQEYIEANKYIVIEHDYITSELLELLGYFIEDLQYICDSATADDDVAYRRNLLGRAIIMRDRIIKKGRDMFEN